MKGNWTRGLRGAAPAKLSLYIAIAMALGIAVRGGVAPQASPGSVAGVVVRADGGGPVAKAMVTLGHVSVATGDDGRFAFPQVEPGQYTLAVAAVGYLTTAYGQTFPQRPNAEPAAIVVSPGARLANLTVTLTPGGVVAGRVVDPNGRPIFGAQVEALQYFYQDGWRVLRPAAPVFRTNDLGEFRVYWLAPGSYLLRALPPPSESGREETAPTYFPGVADPRAATPIEVQSAVTQGVVLKMSETRLAQIHGTVLDGLSGQPVTARLTLAPQTPEPAQLLYRASASAGGTNRPVGAFSIQGVLPGSYYLYVAVDRSSGGQLVMRMPIEIGDRDIDNLTVVAKPLPLQGRVTLEDWPAGFDPAQVRPRMAVQLQLDPPILALAELQDSVAPRLQTVVNDGAFSFPSVMPADYRVAMNLAIPGFADAYVKSIRLLDSDVIDEGLHLGNHSEPWLDVVVGLNGVSLSGVVLDGQRQPVRRATVVLAPDRRNQITRYKTIQTDAQGRFQLHGIAPGDYMLFAWEAIESGAWFNTDAIHDDESQAASVHASEGAHGDGLELTVIPWRPLQ